MTEERTNSRNPAQGEIESCAESDSSVYTSDDIRNIFKLSAFIPG